MVTQILHTTYLWRCLCRFLLNKLNWIHTFWFISIHCDCHHWHWCWNLPLASVTMGPFSVNQILHIFSWSWCCFMCWTAICCTLAIAGNGYHCYVGFFVHVFLFVVSISRWIVKFNFRPWPVRIISTSKTGIYDLILSLGQRSNLTSSLNSSSYLWSIH